MINLSQIDDLARRLGALVPEQLHASQQEVVSAFKDILYAGLDRLDLVTRKEFDVQQAVLRRTREKLEALEKKVTALEAQQRPSS